MEAPLSWPPGIYGALMARSPELRYLDRSPAEAGLRRALERLLRPGASLLDVGCGVGIAACHLAAAGLPELRYLGIDPDPEACAAARALVGGLPLASARVEQRSLQEHAALESRTFDVVLWVRALHESVEPGDPQSVVDLVRAAAGLVARGGHLLLVELVTAADAGPEARRRIEEDARATVGRHGNGGKPHLGEAEIRAAFQRTPLRLLEREDHPRSLLSVALGRAQARQLLLVYGQPREDAS